MSYKILCLVAPLKEFKWKFDWKAFHENYVKRNELSSWSFDFFCFLSQKSIDHDSYSCMNCRSNFLVLLLVSSLTTMV